MKKLFNKFLGEFSFGIFTALWFAALFLISYWLGLHIIFAIIIAICWIAFLIFITYFIK